MAAQPTDEDQSAEQPYNAADPEQVNAARKRSARHKRSRLDFVQAMMSHSEGRAWMYELLVFCHIGATPFVQGDAYATHIKIGEMNVGNKLMADIGEAAPEQYMVMISEGRSNK